MKFCALSAVLGWFLCSVTAAQLPFRRYSTADGLANNSVHHIVTDAQGFLWFATSEGLSRFDGYTFTNENIATGLPNQAITQVLIDRRGIFWLATPAGLVRFRPEQPRGSAGRITLVRPHAEHGSERTNALYQDRSGRIWVGNWAGLFYIDSAPTAGAQLTEVSIGMPPGEDSIVNALTEDRQGALWIGAPHGKLYRRLSDGRVERYQLASKPEITDLLTDRQGRVWIATELGIYRAELHSGLAPVFEHLSGKPDSPPDQRVHALFESREGDIWAGMFQHLAQFPHDGPVRVWTKNYGLSAAGTVQITTLGQDRDGNLWLGTDDLGTLKLAAGGLLTYSKSDGLGADQVNSIGETLRGELFAAGREGARLFVSTLAGDRFGSVQPKVPKDITYFGWRPARTILQDHTGEWWLATPRGLCRYTGVDNPTQLGYVSPKSVYSARDGLPNDEVIRLYEDRAGDIWVAAGFSAVHWKRSEDRFITRLTNAEARITAFGEDYAGELWIGDEKGQLWRERQGILAKAVGAPGSRTWITDILSDHASRLWVATSSQGLLRFDQPAAADPQFRRYGIQDGLSSQRLLSLGSDRAGSIYVGTGGSGVDRLDADRGRVWHYTSADGLPPGQVFSIYCDRGGSMWFGTSHGLARMSVGDSSGGAPPPVWITGVSVGGQQLQISRLGTRTVRRMVIPPGREHIQFDFVGLSFAAGGALRYQYRLGEDEWSQSIEARSVHYGALASGHYRFAVRAINADGVESPEAATVEFFVAEPLWRRAWFRALFCVAALLGAVVAHRARVSRLLTIERVRTHIAIDLHDDIGSSLSQIAILSEVAQGRLARGDAGEPLARMGELSRELLDSIGDIVWAIQPRKDRMSDLQHRMRRFASEVLSSRNIAMRWPSENGNPDLMLNVEARRQVYLIFKEAINNAARHSHATEVSIGLHVAGRRLALEVSDNGRGIDSGEQGNGLKSMKLRAQRLGGVLEVRSKPGEGATIRLRATLEK